MDFLDAMVAIVEDHRSHMSIRELGHARVVGHRPERVRLTDATVCFKTVDMSITGILRGFAELACVDLAQRVDVPVPPVRSAVHPEWGLGLVSPFIDGTYGARPKEHRDAVNAGDYPVICVFEEWVMNRDDKPSHFILQPTAEGERLVVTDHGHTLERGRPDIDADYTLNSCTKMTYDLTGPEAVEPGIDRIQAVTDSVIRESVEGAMSMLRATVDDPDHYLALESVFEDASLICEQSIRLLQKRRDNLGEVMADKAWNDE